MGENFVRYAPSKAPEVIPPNNELFQSSFSRRFDVTSLTKVYDPPATARNGQSTMEYQGVNADVPNMTVVLPYLVTAPKAPIFCLVRVAWIPLNMAPTTPVLKAEEPASLTASLGWKVCAWRSGGGIVSVSGRVN